MTRALPVTLLLLLSFPAPAQQNLLTIDDIFDPDKKVDFDGRPPRDLQWIDASHYCWPRQASTPATIDWLKVDALSGAAQPLFDTAKMEAVLKPAQPEPAAAAQR